MKPARARSPGSSPSRAIAPLIACAPAAGLRLAAPIEDAGEIPDSAPIANETIEAAQENRRLYSCLEELETRQQAAIRAAFIDGLTYEELAERSSVPLGTMKSWIRRGLAKLRACLER